jgi:hypothetical protein
MFHWARRRDLSTIRREPDVWQVGCLLPAGSGKVAPPLTLINADMAMSTNSAQRKLA